MNPVRVMFSGRLVNAFDMRPQDVAIVDIEHSLSRINRWGGHAREVISVAAHSIFVLGIARRFTDDPAILLRALMHDAFECYLGDISTPIKANLTPNADVAHGASLSDVERRGLTTIFNALGVPLDTSTPNRHAPLGGMEFMADQIALEAERALLTRWEREAPRHFLPIGNDVQALKALVNICNSSGPYRIQNEFRYWFDDLRSKI